MKTLIVIVMAAVIGLAGCQNEADLQRQREAQKEQVLQAQKDQGTACLDGLGTPSLTKRQQIDYNGAATECVLRAMGDYATYHYVAFKTNDGENSIIVHNEKELQEAKAKDEEWLAMGMPAKVVAQTATSPLPTPKAVEPLTLEQVCSLSGGEFFLRAPDPNPNDAVPGWYRHPPQPKPLSAICRYADRFVAGPANSPYAFCGMIEGAACSNEHPIPVRIVNQ